MKFIAIFLLIYAFIKSIYYGIYEIKAKKNKPGGITVIFLALIGLIFPVFLLVKLY